MRKDVKVYVHYAIEIISKNMTSKYSFMNNAMMVI